MTTEVSRTSCEGKGKYWYSLSLSRECLYAFLPIVVWNNAAGTTHRATHFNQSSCARAFAFTLRTPSRNTLRTHQACRVERVSASGRAVPERVDDNTREVCRRFRVVV